MTGHLGSIPKNIHTKSLQSSQFSVLRGEQSQHLNMLRQPTPYMMLSPL